MTNKERLEEIKEWFNNDEEVHEFQIEWLIEQAEEVEQLKEAMNLASKQAFEYMRYWEKAKTEKKHLQLEIERVFDNWTLGNINDERFSTEIHLMVRKFHNY